MATIIAVLIAVMVDRYLPILPGNQVLMRARSAAWLNSYLFKIVSFLEKLSINQTYLIILSALVPLCIALFIIKLIFGLLLGAIGNVIFTALALFYFLGNRQKDSDEAQNSPFIIAHENSFGVLFWFMIFGPTGAFFYWFLVVGKQTPFLFEAVNDSLRKAMQSVHAIAAWIPARITGFIYALVGNFDPGFKCWMGCMRDAKLASSQVLQDCGQAALSTDVVGEDQRLVTRAFIAWVVLLVIKGLI